VSFAVRNTIVLAILLVLVLIFGGYWTSIRQPNKIRLIEEEIKKVDTELLNSPDLLQQYNVVQTELEALEARWSQRTKDIPAEDITSQTNAYLNGVLFSSGRVKADVQFIGTKQEQRFGWNTYSLKGEGPFYGIYRFIWSLENGRRLFKLSKLILRQAISRDPEYDQPYPVVEYDIEMKAYFTPLTELSSSIAWRDTSIVDLGHNPFWPLIRPDVPPNVEGLVEVDKAELKAIIPGKAFVSDHKGKVWELSVGDRVYMGYLSKISPEESKVEFVINRGGISETVVLKVRYRQSPNEGKK